MNAGQKYYSRHSTDIIKRKTLRKVQLDGRLPRESTIAKNNIDREVLERKLMEFAFRNPDSKATRRIFERLGKFGENEKNISERNEK